MHVEIVAELEVAGFADYIWFDITSPILVGKKNLSDLQIQVEVVRGVKITHNGKSIDLDALDKMLSSEHSPESLIARVKGVLLAVSSTPVRNLTGTKLLKELKTNGWGQTSVLITADEFEIIHHGTLDSFEPTASDQ